MSKNRFQTLHVTVNIYFVQFACLKYLNILVKQAENSWHWCIYIHIAWMLTPMQSLNCSIPNCSSTYFKYLHLIASISIKGSLVRIRLIAFNFNKISWRNTFAHSGIVCTMPRSLLLFSEKNIKYLKKNMTQKRTKKLSIVQIILMIKGFNMGTMYKWLMLR